MLKFTSLLCVAAARSIWPGLRKRSECCPFLGLAARAGGRARRRGDVLRVDLSLGLRDRNLLLHELLLALRGELDRLLARQLGDARLARLRGGIGERDVGAGTRASRRHDL